jgi:hypothetical protein
MGLAKSTRRVRLTAVRRADGMRRRKGVGAVLDIIFVGVTVALFGLMAVYAIACDKL